MRRLRFLLLSALCLATAGSAVAACEDYAEALSLVRDGKVLGSLVADSAQCKTEARYRVDNNGRGARLAETILYDDRSIPRAYSIKGTSEFGGKVDEQYAFDGGSGKWRSQADDGDIAGATPRLYIANDASPYSLAVYARALLASREKALPTAPDGRLRITRVAQRKLKSAGHALTISFYRMEGRSAWPDYVALDERNRLFATVVDGNLLLRDGWERDERAVSDEFARLETQYAEMLQKTLAHRITRPLHIRNVHVFDAASGTIGPKADVIVIGDRIREIAIGGLARKVKGGLVVDGDGGVLMPGLHDSHVHYAMEFGLRYLAAGITTIRDMGNDNDRLLNMVADIRSGKVAGPDIVYNGFIDGRSPYSANSGFVVDSLPSALDAVRWYKRHGYFQIKLYSSLDPEWVKPMASLAHSLGMGVTGHIPSFTTPDAMIDAGYDEIAHGSQLMLGWLIKPGEDTRTTLRVTAIQRAADLDLSSAPVLKTIEHLRRKNITIDMTAVIREQTMMSRAGETPPTYRAVIDHLPIGMRRDVRRTYYSIGSREEDERYRRAFAKTIELVGVLHANGIRILAGTDHGDAFALQRELELYAQAGIRPSEILSNATIGMARYLKRGKDHGSIEVGKKADMFIVTSDPTKDISNIRKVSIVFKGGSIYYPDEIYRALNIKPFSEHPNVQAE